MSHLNVIVVIFVFALVCMSIGYILANAHIYRKHFAGDLIITNTNDSPKPYMHLELISEDAVQRVGRYVIFEVSEMNVHVDLDDSTPNQQSL